MRLFDRNELRTIVDNAALPVSSDPAECPFHPHPDFCLIRPAANLCSHPWPLIKLNNCKYVGSELFELLACGMDDGVRDNGAGAYKSVINDFSGPAASRAE